MYVISDTAAAEKRGSDSWPSLVSDGLSENKFKPQMKG